MIYPLNALVAEWNCKVASKFHGKTVSLESHTTSQKQSTERKYLHLAMHITHPHTHLIEVTYSKCIREGYKRENNPEIFRC